MTALRWATALYATGLVIHTADHFRRGTGAVTTEVLWAGSASTAVAVVVIAAVFTGHRLAPILATVTGFAVAFGVAAVHLTPRWSALSDSFPDAGRSASVTPVSWAVVAVEIAGALLMGLAALKVVRGEGVGGVPSMVTAEERRLPQ